MVSGASGRSTGRHADADRSRLALVRLKPDATKADAAAPAARLKLALHKRPAEAGPYNNARLNRALQQTPGFSWALRKPQAESLEPVLVELWQLDLHKCVSDEVERALVGR